MALWEAMAKAFNKDTTLKDLSSEGAEAVIDALVLVLYADGKASFLEKTELEHLLHEMPWTHGKDDEIDAYTEASAARVEALHSRAEFDAFVETIAARLEGTDIREKAYELAARLAHADWQINKGERDALDALSDGLGISTERAAELFAVAAAAAG